MSANTFGQQPARWGFRLPKPAALVFGLAMLLIGAKGAYDGLLETGLLPPSGPASVQDVRLGRGPANGQPEVVTAFKQSDATIHTLVRLNGAAEGAKVRVVLSAVDIGQGGSQMIQDRELPVSNPRSTLDFWATNPQLWPVGRYQTEVYLNGELQNTTPFTVGE